MCINKNNTVKFFYRKINIFVSIYFVVDFNLVFFCQLIKDLQLFGYSLERIKTISDLFGNFLALRRDPNAADPAETAVSLDAMADQIQVLQDRMELLRSGMGRWEDLLKKKSKEISSLRTQNRKRNPGSEVKKDA